MICLVLASVIFFVDLCMPLGVAGGVPYIVVILVAVRLSCLRSLYFIAALCTVLTILGFYLSPSGGEFWQVIFNRCLAILAIWVTAILSLKHKKAADALYTNEQQLRLMTDTLPVLIATLDKNEHFQLHNAAWTEWFYLPFSQLRGMRLDDVLDKAVYGAMQSRIGTTLQGKRSVFTLEMADANNDTRRIQASLVPNRDSAGTISGFDLMLVDLTNHLRTEEALRQSEERYRLLVENAPVCIHETDLNGQLIAVNTMGLRMMGVETQREICGKLFVEMLSPRDRARVEAQLKRVHSGESLSVEFQCMHEGDSRDIFTSFVPMTDKNGHVVKALGVSLDISDRKRAEEQLKKAHDELEMRVQERTTALTEINERLKREIVEREKAEKSLRESYNLLSGVSEGTTDAIYVKDHVGRYLMMNTAGATILGKSKDEVIGNDDRVLFPPEVADSIMARDRRILSSGCMETYEENLTTAGVARTFFSIKGPHRDDRGSIIGIIGISRDITQRKHAEEALQASEERFRALYENNPSMFFTVNEDGVILSVNTFGAEQLGYAVEELVGHVVTNIFHDDDRDPVKKHLATLIKYPNDIGHWEFRKVHKNGRVLWVKEAARVVKGIDSELIILIVCEDITRRKQAEMKLRQAHDELEHRVNERTAALSHALEQVETLKNRLQAENVYLQQKLKVSQNFTEIITNSSSLKKVLSQVEQVATTDATVLILGESGTGKELIARAIHNASLREERSLVKVDCTTLPANLIESELFGHEKGAFTGAISRRIGRFELADKGTIFLDEIGDLPLDLQTKLLRILQLGEFERVGGTSTIMVNVRIIAATHRNLERAVHEGLFREDLYYRLNVFPIRIPPLRERKEDIPALRERKEDIPVLTNHFIRKFSAKLGKNIHKLPQKALKRLDSYHWPGNIRELENVVERAVIVSSGDTIELDEGFFQQFNPSETFSKNPTIKEMEYTLIRKALEESNWVIQGKRGAAVRLDMPPSTLRERMRKYNIKKP